MNKLLEEFILHKYKNISFDIFDTLIERDVSDPLDIFALVEKETGEPNFRIKRIQAEKIARNKIHPSIVNRKLSIVNRQQMSHFIFLGFHVKMVVFVGRNFDGNILHHFQAVGFQPDALDGIVAHQPHFGNP